MHKFALEKIEAVNGKQEIDQLKIDDKGVLDEFEDELASQYQGEFKTLLAYMEYIANNNTLPKQKFRDITPKKETVREYEFKSKHLRVYAIQKPGGKIIILAGYKNDQDSDLVKFRSRKSQYLSTLNGRKK